MKHLYNKKKEIIYLPTHLCVEKKKECQQKRVMRTEK